VLNIGDMVSDHAHQRHRAIEALEACAPPPADSMATLLNSLQNRVNSITL